VSTSQSRICTTAEKGGGGKEKLKEFVHGPPTCSVKRKTKGGRKKGGTASRRLDMPEGKKKEREGKK